MELANEFTVDVPLEEAWTVLTDVRRIAPCMPGAALEEVDGDDYHGVVKVKVGPITAEYRGKAHFIEQDGATHRAVLRAEGRETRGQGAASATITATLEPSGSGTRVSVATDLALTGRVAQFGRGVLADVSNRLLGQFVDALETTVLSDGASSEAVSSEAVSSGAPAPEAASSGAASSVDPASEGGASGGGASGARPGAAEKDARAPGASVPGVTEVRPPRAGSNGAGGGAGALPAGREVVPVNLLSVVGPAVLKRAAFPVAAALAIWVLRLLRRRRHA